MSAAARSALDKVEVRMPRIIMIPKIRIRSKSVADDWHIPLKFSFSDAVDDAIDAAKHVHPRDTLNAPPTSVTGDTLMWRTRGIYNEHPLMYMLMEKDTMVRGVCLDEVTDCLGIASKRDVTLFKKKFVGFVNASRGLVFPWLPKVKAGCVFPQIGYRQDGPATRPNHVIPLFLLPFLRNFLDSREVVEYDLHMAWLASNIYMMYKDATGDTSLMERTYAQFMANQAASQSTSYRELWTTVCDLRSKVTVLETNVAQMRDQVVALTAAESARASSQTKRASKGDGQKGKKTKRRRIEGRGAAKK